MSVKELLDHILCPNKTNNRCFLCLNPQESVLDIFDFFEVHGTNFSVTISLYLMMKELFPTHEILLKQACHSCSNLIIQFYTFIKRSKDYQNSITLLVENMNSKIRQNIETTLCYSYIIDLSKGIQSVSMLPLRGEQSNENNAKCTILQQRRLKNKALICDVCGKASKSPRALSIHRKGHQSKPCPVCNKLLKTHQHFNVHIQNHNSIHRRRNVTKMKYSCNDCKYKSSNKKSLESHINKNHLNIRPYICALCGKGFYKKSHQTEHILIHSKTKLYTCETCGEGFGRRRSLQEHARLHSGAKPFSCEVCGEKFVTASRRNCHIKRKHEVKQEICDICGLVFSLKWELKRHKSKFHEIKEGT